MWKQVTIYSKDSSSICLSSPVTQRHEKGRRLDNPKLLDIAVHELDAVQHKDLLVGTYSFLHFDLLAHIVKIIIWTDDDADPAARLYLNIDLDLQNALE